ncbi:hypothetical protein ABFS82_14G068800 [Erythranthe guttata]
MKPSSSSSCISKILRRILCFSTSFSSSSSFDTQIKEERETSSLVGGAFNNPGIVARLMGLNTLPLRIEPIDGSPSISSSDSVIKKSGSPQVRRRRNNIVNLAYKELEDENYFILSFEHESKVERKKLRKKKSNRVKRRESLHENNNKENEGGVNSDFRVENSSDVLRPLMNSCGESEKTRKKKGSGDYSFETEVYSEKSSPNSVLEFPNDQESASSGDTSRLLNSKMRRTLSEELDSCGNSKEKKVINNGFCEEEEKLRNRDKNYAEKWEELGKVAAIEIIKLSWVQNEISIDENIVKEIGNDLASTILDQLLDELLIISIP